MPADFEFFVGGIEDGIIQILTQRLKAPEGYLKAIDTYGGELDADTLKKFVSELAPRFPLALVAYGDGEDKMMPATAPVFGEPRIWQHSCHFTVLTCDDNARGERKQRRGASDRPGVIKMISDVRDILAGLKFRKEGELLTYDPLKPGGVEYIARLPGLTAYASHFETYWRWTEPDRREPGIPVSDLIFEVEPLNEPASGPGGKTGVVVR